MPPAEQLAELQRQDGDGHGPRGEGGDEDARRGDLVGPSCRPGSSGSPTARARVSTALWASSESRTRQAASTSRHQSSGLTPSIAAVRAIRMPAVGVGEEARVAPDRVLQPSEAGGELLVRVPAARAGGPGRRVELAESDVEVRARSRSTRRRGSRSSRARRA